MFVISTLPVATGEILLSVPLCVVSETPAASGLFSFFETEQNLSVSESHQSVCLYVFFTGLFWLDIYIAELKIFYNWIGGNKKQSYLVGIMADALQKTQITTHTSLHGEAP